jgi:putative exporter of polyketide antibiotics
MIAGLVAFAGFMVTSLAAGISALKYVDYLSPFHYYNKPSPLIVEGLQIGDTLILVIITAVLIAAGYVFFAKRDIYQR